MLTTMLNPALTKPDSESASSPTACRPILRQLLHVGCGAANKERLPACFQTDGWQEIRLDIDPRVTPDIIGSITDLHMITDASVDAIWSSHNLEHLNSFEVPKALAEFQRVLRPDGFALISLPDLNSIAKEILKGNLTQKIYHAPCGPITALDVLFGHQESLQHGMHYMAHRTGFTATTLGQVLIDAGFHEVRVHQGQRWDLWALATMPQTDDCILDQLAGVMA